MPATTSSPCALTRKSPYAPFAPVAGSRVNPTPVPEFSSRLPNTMAWTLTAVPRSCGMCSRLRYATARVPVHDVNTALDREPDLLDRVLRERPPGLGSMIALVGARQVAQQLGRDLAVGRDAREVAGGVEQLVEAPRVDAEDDAPEHRDEATVRVVREALVAGLLGETLDATRRSSRGSGPCPSCPASRARAPDARSRATDRSGRRAAVPSSPRAGRGARRSRRRARAGHPPPPEEPGTPRS